MTIRSEPARRQTVQSAQVGLEVLKALARLAPSASLSALAEAAGMPASKAHRYLMALIAGGFAEQDPSTGRYALGPEALYIGVAALGRIDVVAAAAGPLAALNAELNHTCFLAVWGNRGPTVVQVREAVRAVTVVTRVGSVLPLLTSASGLAFAAYLPSGQTDDIVQQELADIGVAGDRAEALAAARARMRLVRERGLSIIRSLYHPGVDAVAAPVFGPGGGIAAVITVLGPTTSLDPDPDGPDARAVLGAATAICARIGHRSS